MADFRSMMRPGLSFLLLAAALNGCGSDPSSSGYRGVSGMVNGAGERLNTAAAPAGNAVEVASSQARQIFPACGAVVSAERTGEGGIRAICQTGEAFRVFTVPGETKPTILRCHSAAQLGVIGC